MIKRGASRKVSLRVCELFCSIQGETAFSGFPRFLSALRCNLNCALVRHPYARAAGSPMTADKILKAVIKHRFIHHVTLTGGEPLLQEHAPALMDMLLEKDLQSSWRQTAAWAFKRCLPPVRKIADVKTPSSGEEGSFNMKNLGLLGPGTS